MLSPSNPKIRLLLISILISVLSLSACAAQPAYMGGEGGDFEKAAGEPVMAPEMEAPAESVMSSDVGEYRNIADTSAQSTERIVIKNASMELVVLDPPKSMESISNLAEDFGGFVVSANMYMQKLDSGAEVPRASITIRVPAERFNEALGLIRSESEQAPLSARTDSQDVTKDYVDLQSRLRNLENTEAQLAEIMESAKKTEDVLAVHNQLVQVREQIEVIKGQIKYYEESAAFSAISTELIADEAVQPLTIGGWQPEGVAKSAIQALINTLKFLAEAIIWIVLFLTPVLLVLYIIFVLPISFLWRTLRRRRAKKKEDTLPPPDEKNQVEQQ